MIDPDFLELEQVVHPPAVEYDPGDGLLGFESPTRRAEDSDSEGRTVRVRDGRQSRRGDISGAEEDLSAAFEDQVPGLSPGARGASDVAQVRAGGRGKDDPLPRLRICEGCGTLFEAKAWQVKYGRDKTCPVCTPPDPHHDPEYRRARRKRMVLAGHRCEQCGSKEKLQCHHVNGKPTDHRIENLRMLCLRCHQARTRLQLEAQGRRFDPTLGVLVRAKRPAKQASTKRKRRTKQARAVRLV